jgi:hypothetical protein
MKRKTLTLMIGMMVSSVVSACNLPFASSTQSMPPDTNGMVTETTGGPEQTFTPSFSPTSAATFTLSKVNISVSVDTNCRRGPGQVYDYIGGLMVGETTEVIAKDPTGRYWYISNPDGPGFCWVWTEYATITGDTSLLPVYTPEPTPTPPPTATATVLPSFSVAYADLAYCGICFVDNPDTRRVGEIALLSFALTGDLDAIGTGGCDLYGNATLSCTPGWYFRFQVKNTGSLTWESIRVFADDGTVAYSNTTQLDHFQDLSGCAFQSDQGALLPGQTVYVTSNSADKIPYNPTGHDFMATIKLCSADGLSGSCLSKTISFTP